MSAIARASKYDSKRRDKIAGKTGKVSLSRTIELNARDGSNPTISINFIPPHSVHGSQWTLRGFDTLSSPHGSQVANDLVAQMAEAARQHDEEAERLAEEGTRPVAAVAIEAATA